MNKTTLAVMILVGFLSMIVLECFARFCPDEGRSSSRPGMGALVRR
jgi:hypothetical protein